MAKQIKVIKCPQCGNTKPASIGNDHYRCDKCDTEFFLDNDDVNVNVNVNHQYDRPVNRPVPQRAVWTTGIILSFVILIVIVKVCVSQAIDMTRDLNAYQVIENFTRESNTYPFSVLLPGDGQGTAFHLTCQDGVVKATFREIISGNVIQEQEVANLSVDKAQNISYRWFRSDSTHYVIAGENLIYKISPQQRTFTDITAEICSRKPALAAGIMSVTFVPDGQGDGFAIHTNLGKELYYFPQTDMLYSEKAFRYLTTDTSKPLPVTAKEVVYYLFRNTESAHSSNVAQLFEIRYRFNNGEPENRLTDLDEAALWRAGGMNAESLKAGDTGALPKFRIISCKPITDERVYFSPLILFNDSKNLLISFQPSLAEDAGTHLQLLDTSGNIVWTTPFKNKELKTLSAVRTTNGFLLQLDESNFFEISADGQKVQSYKLP